MNRAWYVVTVKPRQEASVLKELKARKLKAVCPVETRWRYPAHGPRYKAASPVLNGYVFVRLTDEFAQVRAVPGVGSFISRDGRPASIGVRHVASLRRQEMRGEFDHTKPNRKPLTLRQRVKIKRGALAERFATIMRLDEKERVILLLEATGVLGAAPVTLHLDDLQAA